jgi:hypothetical protein
MLNRSDIEVPIEYAGDTGLLYDSFSVAGCRTSACQSVVQDVTDTAAGRLHFQLTPWVSGYSAQPFLPAGSGPIMSLYFTVDEGATYGDSVTLAISSFAGGAYELNGSIYGQPHPYSPSTRDIALAMSSCCIANRGNVDNDPLDQVTLGDLTALIDHLFVSFDDLDCWEESNVDQSLPEGGTSISLGDLTVLIDHLFLSFGDLPPCP